MSTNCVSVKSLNMIHFTKSVNLTNLVYFSDALVAVRHLSQPLHQLQSMYFSEILQILRLKLS